MLARVQEREIERERESQAEWKGQREEHFLLELPLESRRNLLEFLLAKALQELRLGRLDGTFKLA